ncbi:MAG TPA: hypothetical protein VFW90_03765 [Candidatus Saccharimonadales bacterium]|nr:hypothetical protein [Candidatus Saccharimonadales bacterium]
MRFESPWGGERKIETDTEMRARLAAEYMRETDAIRNTPPRTASETGATLSEPEIVSPQELARRHAEEEVRGYWSGYPATEADSHI